MVVFTPVSLVFVYSPLSAGLLSRHCALFPTVHRLGTVFPVYSATGGVSVNGWLSFALP